MGGSQKKQNKPQLAEAHFFFPTFPTFSLSHDGEVIGKKKKKPAHSLFFKNTLIQDVFFFYFPIFPFSRQHRDTEVDDIDDDKTFTLRLVSRVTCKMGKWDNKYNIYILYKIFFKNKLILQFL